MGFPGNCNRDLPLPPDGMKGWPWEYTEEVEDTTKSRRAASDLMNSLPLITVVTPSFNQGAFLEATIRSVIMQCYPKIEYIVIDGGSTDDSLRIIKKYQRFIAYWVSEPDRGQAHALNKGFAKGTGQVFVWLNSDDFFMPNAFFNVVECCSGQEKWSMIVGKARKIREDGKTIWEHLPRKVNFESIAQWRGNYIAQAACFFSPEVFKMVSGLSEEYHYALDVDLWLKMARIHPAIRVDKLLACHREHRNAKTAALRGKMWAETRLVQIRHGREGFAMADMESLFNQHYRTRKAIKSVSKYLPSFLVKLASRLMGRCS